MKKYFTGLSLVAIMAFVMVSPITATAQEAETKDMAQIIKALMVQIEQLQKRVAELRGEITEVRKEMREEIANALKMGMSSEEVRKLQQLLATDTEIYPESLVTGYYGPMTRGAVIRLQQRHKLETTGEVDAVTRELVNAYLEKYFNGTVPVGLLRTPGIQKEVENRVCERGVVKLAFCSTTDKKTDTTTSKDTEEYKKEEYKKDDVYTDDKKEVFVMTQEKARTMVGYAIDAERALMATIDRASGDVDIRPARRALSEVRTSIDSARQAVRAGDYNKAYDEAISARDTAKAAIEALRKLLGEDTVDKKYVDDKEVKETDKKELN